MDSHELFFNSLAHVFKMFGSELSVADRKEALRTSAKEQGAFLAKRFGAEAVPDLIRAMRMRNESDMSQTQVFPGIYDLLEALSSREFKIGVWTARDRESTEQILQVTGLDRYVSVLKTANCISRCKPDPEGLRQISEHFKCLPSSIAMVGDHDNDMKAARAFGSKGIRAFWHNPDEVFNCDIADQQFASVESLRSWIESYDAPAGSPQAEVGISSL